MKILDLSAGNRAIWYDKKNPLATFIDIRPEVNPDIVVDSRELGDKVGSGYGLVVFDPPHFCNGPKSEMAKSYGYWNTAHILDTVKRTAAEAHRVSVPNALMAFKWNTHDIKLQRVLDLMSEYWEPLFGQVSKYLNKSVQTYWVLLKRRDIK